MPTDQGRGARGWLHGGVHVRALLDAPVPAGALFTWVSDLDRYPQWLDMVGSATPCAPGGGDGEPAWDVVLQARLGPLRRSKKLRMERTGLEPDRWVRFERREQDGRSHAGWKLEAHLEPAEPDAGADPADALAAGPTTKLVMDLSYDGGLWSPPLEHLLHREIERGGDRLSALAQGRA